MKLTKSMLAPLMRRLVPSSSSSSHRHPHVLGVTFPSSSFRVFSTTRPRHALPQAENVAPPPPPPMEKHILLTPDDYPHEVSVHAEIRSEGATTNGGSARVFRVYESKGQDLLPEIHMYNSLYLFMVRRWEQQPPNKVACVQLETGEAMTYKDLLGRTAQVQNVLYNACAVRQGDVVLLCMFDSINYAPVAYGVMGIGATVSTTNATGDEAFLAHHIIASNAAVVVTTKHCLHVVQRSAKLAHKTTKKLVKVLLEETIMKLEADSIPYYVRATEDAKRDDTVLIPFSAGTSGEPKGVMLTNKSILSNLHQALYTFGVTAKDVQLSVLPFFHITGFVLSMSLILAAGGTLVAMTKFDVQKYLRAIGEHNITMALVAPPIVNAMVRCSQARRPPVESFQSLRLVRSAGAPLKSDQWVALQAMFPSADVGQMYGASELSPLALSTRPGTPSSLFVKGAGTLVGALIPNTELRVVQVDDSQQTSADHSRGVDVTEGEEGELWIRGPQRMHGYVDSVATRQAIQDGEWYRTGDIGFIDKATGYVYLTDRLRELIKYKGFLVSPAEVESVLDERDEVDSCVVIGVPDVRDTSFERPRALVKVATEFLPPNSASEEEKASHYASLKHTLVHHVEQRLPPHKRLHGELRFVDDIPKGVSGSINRRFIRRAELLFMQQRGGSASS